MNKTSEVFGLWLTVEAIFATGLIAWYFVLQESDAWLYLFFLALGSLILFAACYISVSRQKEALITNEKKKETQQ